MAPNRPQQSTHAVAMRTCRHLADDDIVFLAGSTQEPEEQIRDRYLSPSVAAASAPAVDSRAATSRTLRRRRQVARRLRNLPWQRRTLALANAALRLCRGSIAILARRHRRRARRLVGCHAHRIRRRQFRQPRRPEHARARCLRRRRFVRPQYAELPRHRRRLARGRRGSRRCERCQRARIVCRRCLDRSRLRRQNSALAARALVQSNLGATARTVRSIGADRFATKRKAAACNAAVTIARPQLRDVCSSTADRSDRAATLAAASPPIITPVCLSSKFAASKSRIASTRKKKACGPPSRGSSTANTKR